MRPTRWLMPLLPLLLAMPVARAAARSKVALTFDDLPVHGAVPPGRTRPDVIRDIVQALRAGGAPQVYGFINAKRADEAPAEGAEILKIWRDAGYPLGNHAYSHMNLHEHTAEEFEKDVLANEPTLRSLMSGADWHWFRYPYLRSGDTIEKRRAVSAMLRRHGYRVAEVTLDFEDWAYHDPYARCVAKNDQESVKWLKETYLARAAESLTVGREAAQALYGRDIGHVMLLHVGGLNAVMMPSLLGLLRDRGFDLVTLDEAQKDPAYAVEPAVALPYGGTLFEQVYAQKQLQRPGRSDSPRPRLAELCK
jgi:peptidoglycan-N-acetylglucosamine deacetylase